jgi:hypothetical protein
MSAGLLGVGNARAQDSAQSLGDDANQQAYDLLRHFGVGLSLTHDLGGDDRIEEATIVDGIVRVTKDSNTRARVMLEWHAWMFCEKISKDEQEENPAYRSVERVKPRRAQEKLDSGVPRDEAGIKSVYWKQEPPCSPTRRSSGAFVAVQPGSDSIIDAIGLGWMFRFPDKLQMFGNRTLNIGLGLIADQNVKVLGDGFVENQPPPIGASGLPEEQVRYRTTTQGGVFAMASLELGQTTTQIPRRSLTFYSSAPDGTKPLVDSSVIFTWGIDDMDKCVASGTGSATAAWTGDRAIKGEEEYKLTATGMQRFNLECTGGGRTVSRFEEFEVVDPAAAAPAAGAANTDTDNTEESEAEDAEDTEQE